MSSRAVHTVASRFRMLGNLVQPNALQHDSKSRVASASYGLIRLYFGGALSLSLDFIGSQVPRPARASAACTMSGSSFAAAAAAAVKAFYVCLRPKLCSARSLARSHVFSSIETRLRLLPLRAARGYRPLRPICMVFRSILHVIAALPATAQALDDKGLLPPLKSISYNYNETPLLDPRSPPHLGLDSLPAQSLTRCGYRSFTARNNTYLNVDIVTPET